MASVWFCVVCHSRVYVFSKILKTRLNQRESRRAFEERFRQVCKDIEILSNGRTLLAIDPDRWFPFRFAQILEPVEATIFRIVKGYVGSGNLVEFSMENRIAVSMRYAGSTMERLSDDD